MFNNYNSLIMNNKVLIDNLRCIPDFPQKGINFRDVTTLYKNAECMKIMLDELEDIYKDKGITKIVGIESRGFVIGAALAARLKTAKFPVVCANYQFANKKLAKVIKPYVIIERGGHKIGIFGLGVNLDGYTAPQTAREVTYLDPVETARKMVSELKAQNCDMIICLSHVGVDTIEKDNDFEIARQVPEIDVIVGGHSQSLSHADALVAESHRDLVEAEHGGQEIRLCMAASHPVPDDARGLRRASDGVYVEHVIDLVAYGLVGDPDPLLICLAVPDGVLDLSG